MNEVIKEINNNEYTYLLGYFLYNDKVYPSIDIYKNNKFSSGGGRNSGVYARQFKFCVYNSSFTISHLCTIQSLFTKLRQYNEIPEYIEREYENMFLLYKLNDFKKI